MKLRYELRGEYYFPQYLKEEKWLDFNIDSLPKNGDFYEIMCSLGNIQLPYKWDNKQYYFKDGTIFFTKKIFVMAFLGAATSFFNKEIGTFEI